MAGGDTQGALQHGGAVNAVACTGCGRQESEPPLSWTRQSGPRGEEWLCERCTREHVRAIEGRLDQEWW